MIHPIILSGGTGTRLWPLSRNLFPKQFQPLVAARSMLQETVARLSGVAAMAAPMILCNEAHRFIVAEQMRAFDLEDVEILVEPIARNTAPAIATAAALIADRDPEAILAVLPADHAIGNVPAFQEALASAVTLAEQRYLVTFGLAPENANIGYGYIEMGDGIDGFAGAHAVAGFHEKPDTETAEHYLAVGGYCWNSGMFVFEARTGLEEFAEHCPEALAAARRALDAGQRDLDFFRLDAEAFGAAPAISFDHAVMERTSRAAVIAGDFGWTDLGSWAALWEIGQKDQDGNVLDGPVVVDDVASSYVRSDGRLVALLGVEDLVVVATDDAVLVTQRAHAERIRDLVPLLQEQNAAELQEHATVYRPWGSYKKIEAGEQFQVKRIVVKPGARLSLQRHRHRAEHWVVVSGTARVQIGEEEQDLVENQSTYVPEGAKHRLANPGPEPLVLIEVQSGDYLGEDDIERFEDDYGR